MRSDRLVAILLMLQRRTQVTAAEVAAEVDVSERTARRDLDALGMAGLPVYSVQGRGGGWRLLGGARTDLSGLSEAEVRALFLVAGPATESTPEVKAALRKLVRALPATFRDHAEAAASSIVIDPHCWGAAGTTADAQHARPAIHVQGSCAPEGIGFLREALEGRLSIGAPDPDGRLPVAFTGPSEAGLAGHLAGLVEWLEISSPPGIREHLAAIGAALTQRYS